MSAESNATIGESASAGAMAGANATLYGVSVGPGDPELVTLKAKRVMESCDVIAAPRTANGDHLALDIAFKAANLDGKTVVYIQSLMTRDPEELDRSHRQQADLLAEHLASGRNVALLNIGDVSVFSTFSYIAEKLASRFAIEAVPGVTSFCAAAAAAAESLTTMNEPLHIIPASGMGTEDALELDGTKVLMKSGRQLGEVLSAIEKAGLSNSAWMVQNCGLPNERVIRNIAEEEALDSYFTLITVRGKA